MKHASLVIISFFFFYQLSGMNIGSDTAPVRFTTQQSVSNGDRIASFALLEAGFSFLGAGSIATFDSFFPVSGETTIAGNRLILGQDLIFSDISMVSILGNISGNGHIIEFSPSVTCLPALSDEDVECAILSDVHFVFNCNTTLKNCCFTFTGNSSINGQGYCLTLDSTCTINVDEASSLLVKDVEIKGVSGNQIRALDLQSTISFQDVTLVLDSDFTFSQGAFDIIKDLNIEGNGYKFIYQSEAISTVQKCGQFLLDRGVTFSYDPPIDAQHLFQLTDDTSTIILNGATFHTTTTGFRLNRGVFDVRAQSFLSVEGATQDVGIIFGNLDADTTVDLRLSPAATLEILQGCFQLDTV